MANAIEREISRLKNLKNYKDLEDNELEPIALRNIEIREFKANPMFIIPVNDSDNLSEDEKKITKDAENDQKLAEQKFRNYLENNEIESASDIDTLKSLVYNEIFEIRIQKELNSSKIPPEKLTKQLVDIQNQKSALKIKLGIDKTEEEQDDLSKLELLQKRTEKYIQEHKHEFTIWIPSKCEKCKHESIESYLLWKRVEDFNSLKHPFFAGRWLFNYEILKDVKEEKISKEDAWRYLICAGQGGNYKPNEDKKYCIDYINYCLENWQEITDLLNRN